MLLLFYNNYKVISNYKLHNCYKALIQLIKCYFLLQIFVYAFLCTYHIGFTVFFAFSLEIKTSFNHLFAIL